MSFRVLLVGGGTGGHVYPLIAVTQALENESQQAGVDIDMRMMGSGPLIEQQAGEYNIKFNKLPASKWRRYFSLMNFVDLIKFPFAFIYVYLRVFLYMPDVIFSKGGYGALLPSLCGRLMAIPVVIHESDTVPGKTSKWTGRFAKTIFTSFESAQKYFPEDKTQWVGQPFRKGALIITDKVEALQQFELDDSKPTIFVTGATQGAQKINETLMVALVELIQKYHVIHQCGPKHYDDLKQQIETIKSESSDEIKTMIDQNYHLYPMLSGQQMGLAYSAADVVIARANSGVHEIAAVGKPAILVPLPSAAQNHQYYNAMELEQHGAIVLQESNFTPHILINNINEAYENRFAMADAIRGFAKPDAAQEVAKHIIALQ